MKDKIFGKLSLLPMLIFIAFFEIFPIYKVLEYSVFKQQIFSAKRTFNGIDNYIRILSDSDFWLSIKNSLYFTFGSIIVQLVIGILIALLLNSAFYGRNIFRSIILFSYVIPSIVAIIVWRFMLSDFTGIINYTIERFHLPIPQYWFSDPKTAMFGVIVVSVWKFFPFMVLMFLAQLQSIDQEQYEAAKIDGANKFHEFWYITLPSLKPVIFIALMLRSIFLFKNFDIIYLLTGGGPINSTNVLPIEIYSKTFKEFQLGSGSAMAVLMFIIILIFSFVYLKLYDRAQKQLVGD